MPGRSSPVSDQSTSKSAPPGDLLAVIIPSSQQKEHHKFFSYHVKSIGISGI
jgi:hypothetical protein